MSRRNKVFLLVFCAAMALMLSDLYFIRRDIWRIFPPTIEATGIKVVLSAKNGFGLNAEGAAFSVLSLSDSTAQRIADDGIPWLNAQSGGALRPDWQPTPVPQNTLWMGTAEAATGQHTAPTILAWRDQYGPGLAISGDPLAAIDAALNAPGSFYAFGSDGMVAVVVPETRRAYVFFTG